MTKNILFAIFILTLTVNAQQLAKLSGGGLSTGSTVLLTSRGAALGAPTANNGQGEVYIYKLPQGGWSDMSEATFTLRAEDGQPGDGFGAAMVTAGNQLIVGAPGHNGGNGAIYVYDNLQLTQELTQDSELGCGLGSSLSTSLSDPKWLVVASPNCRIVDSHGFASLYEFQDGEWALYRSISNSQGVLTVAIGYGTEDEFGTPILAMGIPAPGGGGKVVMWQGNFFVLGFAWDFGAAISMQQSSNLLFVGEPSTGTVYVFYGPNHEGHPFWQTGGKLIATLTDSNLGPNSGFGSSLSARGKALLIGAPGANNGDGVVDLYVQPKGNWASASIPTKSYASADGQGAAGNFGAAIAWQIGKTPTNFIVGAPTMDQNGVGYVEAAQ